MTLLDSSGNILETQDVTVTGWGWQYMNFASRPAGSYYIRVQNILNPAAPTNTDWWDNSLVWYGTENDVYADGQEYANDIMRTAIFP